MQSSMWSRLAGGLMCLGVATSVQAAAVIDPADFEISIQVFGSAEGVPDQNSDVITLTPDATGDFLLVRNDASGTPAPGNPGSPLWDMTSLVVSGNVDPEVFLSTTIVNTSPTLPVDFVAVISVPISGVFGPPSVLDGNFSFTLTDLGGGSGASLTQTPSIPVFQGLVDGVTELTIGDPFSPFTIASGTAGTGPIVGSGFGSEADTSIGIILSGTLSPGDLVQITSEFVVVPEPASALLVLLGAPALLRRRRG